MSQTKKRLLILKSSGDICDAETAHVETIAQLIGMDHETKEINSVADVQALPSGAGQFDYIYLCGHANQDGFGDASGPRDIGWIEFSEALCRAAWLNRDGILFLACCRGGLKSISDALFHNCPKIDYICGPRWRVDKHDLTCGFHAFIYNLEIRGEEPGLSAERASKATGRSFFCYDRLECSSRPVSSAARMVDEAVAMGVLTDFEVSQMIGLTSPPP